MNQALTVLVLIYASLFIFSPLIAVLHELGHAMAYLIFTKPDRIDIYIGTYHRPKNAIRFRMGKLRFHIKRSFPFVKGIGLCKTSKAETNYSYHIIILAAGSVFTFLVALIPALIVFNTPASIYIQIACYIFLGLSTLSLITNLVPGQIDKAYGVNLENDGKKLLFSLKVKNDLVSYVDGCELFDTGAYKGAAAKFKEILARVPGNRKVLDLLVTASICERRFDDAGNYIQMIEGKHELSVDEMLKKGYLQSKTNRPDEAIETFSKLLKRDRQNVVGLNNLAAELIEKGAHKVAAQILEKAIRLEPGFDYSYATFGYSKILQGDLEDGKRLIKQSLDLNPKNADAYKSLGIYHAKLNNAEEAKANFAKALELDAYMDLGPYAKGLEPVS